MSNQGNQRKKEIVVCGDCQKTFETEEEIIAGTTKFTCPHCGMVLHNFMKQATIRNRLTWLGY